MITIIFGAPGSGKSSLATCFLRQVYRREGVHRLRRAQARIAAENTARGKRLSVPEKPPIFANFQVKFKVGYEKWFEPYFVNGYYLGLPNESMETQFIPPHSAVFLGEAQRYFNSRRSGNFPDWVSRFYEMHRHYAVDFWMDVQRPVLIDANIREICRNFIEVREMVHERDENERIVHTTFRCRTFENWGAVENYLSTGEGFAERNYENDGNIFHAFNSYSYFGEFLPPEGKDFKMLPFLAKGQRAAGADAEFYNTSQPKGYRNDKTSSAKPREEQK